MAVRHNRLGEPPGELLAQVPHRLGHLREGGRRLVPLFLQPIEPLVKASMELLAQAAPTVFLHAPRLTR